MKNYSIKCNATSCRHNAKDCNCCQLEGITISCCSGENCTCCADYSEEE